MLKNVCFNIGLAALTIKILLIGIYIYLFIQKVDKLQLLSFLIHCASILALIGLVIFAVATVKKQWGWKLWVGFILNLLALVLYPMVYSV